MSDQNQTPNEYPTTYDRFKKYAVESHSIYQFMRDYYKPERYTGRGRDYAAYLLAAHHARVMEDGFTFISSHDSQTGETVAYYPAEQDPPRHFDQDVENARQRLYKLLSPGDAVYLVRNHQTKNTTWYSVYVVRMESKMRRVWNGDQREVVTETIPRPYCIDQEVAALIPYPQCGRHGGIKISDLQANRANTIVNMLARILFGDGRNLERAEL
jgi:hypothetical protein